MNRKVLFVVVLCFMVAGCGWCAKERLVYSPAPNNPLPPAELPAMAPMYEVPKSRVVGEAVEGHVVEPVRQPQKSKTSTVTVIAVGQDQPTTLLYTAATQPMFDTNLLGHANLAFNHPSSLNISTKADVTLVISVARTVEELLRQLPSGIQESGVIKVSETVEAKLTSTDFDITEHSPLRQTITRDDVTKWDWEITPKHVGKGLLYLTVNAILGPEKQWTIQTFKRELHVIITPKQVLFNWLNTYWQWIVGTIIVPVVGFFAVRYLNKKKRQRK